MMFVDDDSIDFDPVKRVRTFPEGKINFSIFYDDVLPFEETDQFQVLMELSTGRTKDIQSSGMDIVAILDISMSMRVKKFEQIKMSMQFLVDQLGPSDNLSIVTFSNGSEKLCPLIPMDENGKTNVENLINSLSAKGRFTNISAGLGTALEVLKGRTNPFSGRGAILLMTAGDQIRHSFEEVEQFHVGDEVVVYTICFRNLHRESVLYTVANNNVAGKFSVTNAETIKSTKLRIALSWCLEAFAMTAVVKDLELSITPVANSTKIKHISTPSIEFCVGDEDGTTTVNLGDLHQYETCRILVHALLPASSFEMGMKVLEVSYSASIVEQLYKDPPVEVFVERTESAEKLRHASMIQEKISEIEAMWTKANAMALDDQLHEAVDVLVEAQHTLDIVALLEGPKHIRSFTGAWKLEVQNLLSFIEPKLQNHAQTRENFEAKQFLDQNPGDGMTKFQFGEMLPFSSGITPGALWVTPPASNMNPPISRVGCFF